MNIGLDEFEITDPEDRSEGTMMNVRQAIYLRDMLNRWLPYYDDEINIEQAGQRKKEKLAACRKLVDKV